MNVNSSGFLGLYSKGKAGGKEIGFHNNSDSVGLNSFIKDEKRREGTLTCVYKRGKTLTRRLCLRILH